MDGYHARRYGGESLIGFGLGVCDILFAAFLIKTYYCVNCEDCEGHEAIEEAS